MIELRELVAAPGLAPLTASVRIGEVVRLDGPPAAARAVLEVIAGRRTAVAGEVVWRDPRGRAALIRAGERLPPGVDGPAAGALWRALAGGAGGAVSGAAMGGGAAAAARGFGVAPVIWLVDGAGEREVEDVVARADGEVRGGAGALVWTTAAARGHADRTITVEVAAVGARAIAPALVPAARGAGGGPTRAELARGGSALVRFAAAVASSRATLAIAVVSALWLAVVAAVVATHESFWYIEGSGRGLDLLGWLTGLGAAGVAALAASTRAAVGRAWPAMLRETRAAPWLRAAALVVGDAAGAAPAAVVAAWPAIWSAVARDDGGGLTRAPLTTAAVLLAAIAAGAVARLARSSASLGALVGVGVAAALMW